MAQLFPSIKGKQDINDDYERRYLRELSKMKLYELKKIDKIFKNINTTKKTSSTTPYKYTVMSQPKQSSRDYLFNLANYFKLDYEFDENLNFRLARFEIQRNNVIKTKKGTKNLPKLKNHNKTLEDFLKEEDDVNRDNAYLEEVLRETKNSFDETEYNQFKQKVENQPKIKAKKEEVEQLFENMHALRLSEKKLRKNKSTFLQNNKDGQLNKFGKEGKLKFYTRTLEERLNL